jgi:non-ribosomal peptide synthase protein (TIGR01720 family)
LREGYEAKKRGEEMSVGERGSTYGEWSVKLREYAKSEELRKEKEYWSRAERMEVKPIPVDWRGGENREKNGRDVRVSLSREETRELLQEVPKAYRTMINDVLLAGLMESYQEWSGEEMMLVDVEGHGRERGMANGGIGYGVLKYLSEDEELKRKLRKQAKAEIVFNYMGRGEEIWEGEEEVKREAPAISYSREGRGRARNHEGERGWLIEVNGGVEAGRLETIWTYSEQAHKRETIERRAEGFIEGLRRIIAQCKSPGGSGFTPSDFLAPNLSQKDLDELIAELTIPRK